MGITVCGQNVNRETWITLINGVVSLGFDFYDKMRHPKEGPRYDYNVGQLGYDDTRELLTLLRENKEYLIDYVGIRLSPPHPSPMLANIIQQRIEDIIDIIDTTVYVDMKNLEIVI